MAVKSSHADAGFIDPAWLAPGAKWLMRGGMLALFALSWFGTFVTFNGGWERRWTFDELGGAAAALALGVQILLSYAQWCFVNRYGWWSIPYQVVLWPSAGPSINTYQALVVPRIETVLARLPWLWPTIAAWIILIIVCVLFDTMLEKVAIKRRAGSSGMDF